MKKKLTEKQLIKYCRENFHYNPNTGQLWRLHNNRSNLITKKTAMGYIQVTINQTNYYAHRIIWLIIYGYLPKMIDHIDTNRSNNKLDNLRNTNYTGNNRNKSIATRNNGYKGVSPNGKNWKAQLTFKGKTIYLGTYNTQKKAAKAYNEAAIKYFGEFANLNIL